MGLPELWHILHEVGAFMSVNETHSGGFGALGTPSWSKITRGQEREELPELFLNYVPARVVRRDLVPC